MSGWELAYIAGLFDGEGSVSIAHHKKSHKTSNPLVHELFCNIASTHYEAMKWLKEFLGFGNIHKKRCAGYKGARKDIWYWETSNQLAEDFLRMVQPYAIIKEKHIIEALTFRDRQRKNKVGNAFKHIFNDCLVLKRLNGRFEPCRIQA